ncbi:DUF6801 domain-containing protein [Streptomyces viridosporus]|uniref:DUF6801 domain-containing protein n=1 Tax=Streptomyces viridosporus T7A TaxID=665577 RepID=A0ABX6ADL2_STRVD|nr:DUF6801 domain-containing protein [Streptomyces viridosporus]QEU85575.1 hypothetical protein CP969_13235 [Streptomyces viridosporus T7A]
MRGNRVAASRPPRVRARTATIGAFVVLAAMVPAAASAAGSQEVDAELPYICAFPSGELPATVRVSAAFPDRAGAGEAFSPTGVTTTVELPAEAVADLTALGAATARAATRLTVGVTQNEAAAEATWRGTAEPVTLPGSGPLALTTTGDVPSVTGRSDGDLVFSAGDLAVDLELGAADGSAADPGPLTVDCSLAEDAPEEGLLAAVPVGTDAPQPSGPPSLPGSPPGPSGPSSGPEEEQGERAPKVTEGTPGGTAADRDAPPCRYDENRPPTSASLNAYVTGYTNVNKLKGASLLPVSCMLIEQGIPGDGPPDPDHLVFDTVSQGDFHYEGRKRTPPVESTFLAFGFTPVKATMVLEQTGPIRIDSRIKMRLSDLLTIGETYIRAPLVLRVTALEINGTPLDVGPDCTTEKPLTSPEPDPANHPGDHVVLYGRGEQVFGEDATGYMLLTGGPLTGEVTIPAFTGCGTGGERIDRLLTASVSGSGNYVKQIQGQTCSIANPVFETPFTRGECTEDLQPYQIPVPER